MVSFFHGRGNYLAVSSDDLEKSTGQKLPVERKTQANEAF